MDVAHRIELARGPRSRRSRPRSRCSARRRRVARADRVERRLGGEHAGPHREVDALEPHRVQEPAGVAGDQRAVGVDARDRVPAAFGQRLGAVAHHLAALEQRRDERMPLEVLERDVRIEQRILVVEPDDEADRQPAVRHRVDEAAAELLHAAADSPACG